MATETRKDRSGRNENFKILRWKTRLERKTNEKIHPVGDTKKMFHVAVF